MKIETVWVIQRDDGKFLSKHYNFDYNLKQPAKHSWTDKIFNAKIYKDYELACGCSPSNCKPVKIEISMAKDKELEKFITGIKIDFSKQDNNYFEDEYDADISPNILIISLLETINDICRDNNFNSSDILKRYIQIGSVDLFSQQEEKAKIKKLQSDYFSNRDQQVKLLTDRWEKLKYWVLNMRPLIRGANTIFTKGALLDKIFELEKEK